MSKKSMILEKENRMEKKMGNTDMCLRKFMSVRELGNLLGLGKTERYWLVHKGFFETKIIHGKMWVDIECFETWYDNQVKYHKVNGPAPGRELKKWTYSIQEAAEMLEISETRVYALIKENKIETVTINFRKRILKESFDKKYTKQENTFFSESKEDFFENKSSNNREENGSGTVFPAKSESKYITLKEAAGIAGISRQAIAKHIDKNHFLYIRKRHFVRINRESFYQWLHA